MLKNISEAAGLLGLSPSDCIRARVSSETYWYQVSGIDSCTSGIRLTIAWGSCLTEEGDGEMGGGKETSWWKKQREFEKAFFLSQELNIVVKNIPEASKISQ